MKEERFSKCQVAYRIKNHMLEYVFIGFISNFSQFVSKKEKNSFEKLRKKVHFQNK